MFKYWCYELKIKPIYHRKLWEYAFLLQSLYDHDLLKKGMRGIGFGCGSEPIAFYLASKGLDVVVSDLASEKVVGRGWAETGQHTSSIETAFHANLVSREDFNAHVSHQFIDMNALPQFETSYDFCWSICSLEHLGSIRQGLNFVEKSLTALRPGGLAIHTTEFNYLQSDETIDNWPTVLFLRKHFEQIFQNLQ